MPISIECPECDASLSVPDSAAGKSIRCPECKAVVPVPAHDPRPRRSRAKQEADEEEDDEYDEPDEPQLKLGPGIPVQVWIGHVICVVALIVGIVVAVIQVGDASQREADYKEGKEKERLAKQQGRK